MAIVTGDRYLESLVKFVENQAEKLIEGTLVLKLNPVGLRYVQSRLEALAELESLLAGAPVDYLRAYVSDLGDHRALEQLRRILRLLPSLKVVSVLPPPGRDPTPLYLLPFGRVKVLELRGCDLSTSAAKGLLELRFTLEKLICHNSTDALRHVFASRIVDIKDSPQWNRLCFVSCACNGLVLMDESLQLLPVVETLDLSRNKFSKVDNLRKCSKLKHVDLGFNNLRSMSSFSKVSCHIVKLVLRNNALASLHGIENLKSLQGLDLSYNIISKFSEIEILAGLPSLQNLWLEGNPLCCARWFRAQVFSLFSHPDQLTLDDKKISTSELWKWQIIIASRQKQPASFGFYSPVQDDTDVEGSINTKRKRVSRLARIENDERSTNLCSDQESLSCDNEIQSKEENAHTEDEAEIEDLMKKIEYMKKDQSGQWLQEFKEWMDQTTENFADGNKFRSNILHDNKEICLKSETKDEDLAETSRYISDSFQHSGDESSTIVLESETSFADTYTVVSGQRYFDRLGDAASKLFMGHAGGDRAVFKNFNVNQEDLRFLNDEGNVSADAGESQLKSLATSRGDNVNTENIISSSTAINDIMESRSSSACPGSPPHYQEDILHRRHNLEEEFLQLSAESFSVASSDSNTSCCEDESAEFGPSVSHGNQSFISNSSEKSMSSSFVSNYQGDSADAHHDKISFLKQNGTHTSSTCAEGNFVSTDGRESEISTLACSSSFSDAMHDDESLGFIKGETDWLEKAKRKRKPRRRMISLPEEVDAHVDTDSSKKSSDHTETCGSDIVHEGQEICRSSEIWEATQPRNSGDSATPAIFGHCCRDTSSGFNTASHVKDDFIGMYFNSNVAHSGEISRKYVQCNCLFLERPGNNEREVAILQSSEQKLYILLVEACDGSGPGGLEMVGCHGVGDVREVFVGLGLQAIRVCFEGNATYLFITRCVERSRELLYILGVLDSSGVKNPFSLTSLEQIQVNLFEEHICRGSKINILLYSMVLFCQRNFGDNLWLPKSLFMLEGHLLLCTEDLMKFDPSNIAFSPNYFILDSCCAILDVSEMVIDTADSLCVTLALECTSEFHPSEKGYETENSFQKKKATSDHLTWRLKWFSRESLFNFVALVKAIHTQTTSSSLRVKI